ncbi:DUF427 domain-containing protein [Rhizobium laguerreae]|uniref:DUF427 domain-containing protein n=1 Tax=Rhizobium laguerreae TaxID=1076926 RepID=UPI0035E3F8F5
MAQRPCPNHSTYCPYKGEWAYPSLHGRTRDQRRLDHESPYEAVEDILGYLAFYPNDTYSITAYVATIVPPVTNANLLSAENDRPIGPQPGCRIF